MQTLVASPRCHRTRSFSSSRCALLHFHPPKQQLTNLFIAAGMILYELHAPLLLLARGQWVAGVIDNAALKSKMTEAARVLKDAVTILCLELPETPEGKLGLAARESLIELENSYQSL